MRYISYLIIWTSMGTAVIFEINLYFRHVLWKSRVIPSSDYDMHALHHVCNPTDSAANQKLHQLKIDIKECQHIRCSARCHSWRCVDEGKIYCQVLPGVWFLSMFISNSWPLYPQMMTLMYEKMKNCWQMLCCSNLLDQCRISSWGLFSPTTSTLMIWIWATT